MTYARKPYMDNWRSKRIAAGDTQRSVWFTLQMLQDLRAAQNGRSIEATIADALSIHAGTHEKCMNCGTCIRKAEPYMAPLCHTCMNNADTDD